MNAATDTSVPGFSFGSDAWRGGAICAAIVLPAVVFSFRFTSFLHAKDAAFYVCVCALGLAALGRPAKTYGAFGPLWLYLAFALLSSLALPVRVRSDAVVEAARFAILLLGVTLSEDLLKTAPWQGRILGALMASTGIVAALGLFQYVSALPGLFPQFAGYDQRVYSVFGNQDLFGGYLALGIPLLAHRTLARGWTRAAALAGLIVATPALMVSGCRSAWLAAALGVIWALPRTRADARRVAGLLGAGLLLVFISAVLAPEATIDRITGAGRPDEHGARARLGIWRATAALIKDAPLTGVGLGNYAYWSPRYIGAALQVYPSSAAAAWGERHADHPHCEPLRIAAETGVVGLFCWLWFVTQVIRRGRRTGDAGIDGGLLALAAFACFNGPLESVAHMFPGLLLAGMVLVRDPADVARPRLRRVACAAAAFGLTAFLAWSEILPSALLRAAEDAHVAGHPSGALYERALRFPWPNAHAHKGYGIALAEQGEDAAAQRELTRALDGLDTGDLHLALATIAVRRGEAEHARRHALDCLQRWPGNDAARSILEQTARPDAADR